MDLDESEAKVKAVKVSAGVILLTQADRRKIRKALWPADALLVCWLTASQASHTNFVAEECRGETRSHGDQRR